MKVTTPLGADKLLLVDMEASEGISELFKLTLHMQSEDNALVAANIIGKSVTVTLTVTDGPTRHFNGIASRFVQTGVNNGLSYYSADVVPTAWLLTLARDRAIYQTKTVPEIVKAVLTAAGGWIAARRRVVSWRKKSSCMTAAQASSFAQSCPVICGAKELGL